MEITEKNYHSLFEIGVLIKAIQTAIELVAGFVLVFVNYDTLYRWAIFLTGDELTETQTNPIWRFVISFSEGFSATPREFWAFLFISHALVKIFLLWGLFREKLWAYPTSAVVFGLFIVSQVREMMNASSLALWLVTIFDAVLIVLILHEYRKRKKVIPARTTRVVQSGGGAR